MDQISLSFEEGVDIETIFESIRRLVGLKGCPACGLNGFDFRLSLDPIINYRNLIAELPMLNRITIEPAIRGLNPVASRFAG